MTHASEQLHHPTSVVFADVALEYLTFEPEEPSSKMILELIDTRWVQRLRHIKQTGNTNLVYMFAEHSRFGHCLGVAYLASILMDRLQKFSPKEVRKYRLAVSAAALLHDLGHVAPGSHLAERLWAKYSTCRHEDISTRVIMEDPEISAILKKYDPMLPELACNILKESSDMPPWTIAVISGGGWNADRGNWALVDSAMCSVRYGNYNVHALIDAFRISDSGQLVLLESRLDALTHFFVARDSFYRQVFQHRVSQGADALTGKIVLRLLDLTEKLSPKEISEKFNAQSIFIDDTLLALLSQRGFSENLKLETVFSMTENWWGYHVERWCSCEDSILKDLSTRLRDRRLFKTIRIDDSHSATGINEKLLESAKQAAKDLGYNPDYYVSVLDSSDKHRKEEEIPLILKDSGEIVPVTAVEPLISNLIAAPKISKKWLVAPKSVKEKLGRIR